MKTVQINNNIYHDLSARIENSYYRTIASNLIKLEAATNVFRAFKQKGILAVPLKGIALIETLYHNPALRPMTDIDLLIEAEDIEKIKIALNNIGYDFISYDRGSYNFMHTEHNIMLDLHTKFTRYEMLFNINKDEIYRRLQTVNFNDQIQVNVLCPEHQVIHIALHIAPGLYSDLNVINILDLYHLLNNPENPVDWEYIIEFAKQSRIASYIYVPLFFCIENYHLQVPEDVLAEIRHGLSSKKKVYIQECYLKDIIKGNITGLKIFIDKLRWAEGFSNKLKILKLGLLPDRKDISEQYDVPERSLRIYKFYVLRLCKLFKDIARRRSSENLL